VATGAWPSIVDLASRSDPSGRIRPIAELLSQCNNVYEDMPMMEANEKTGHVFVFRTSIPTGYWIGYNQGTPYSKSTTAKSRLGIGHLRDYSQVDWSMANHSGDPEEFRQSEDIAFLQGMSQTIEQTLIYGNSAIIPQSFMGLFAFYNTLSQTAANSANVIDGLGTGSSNASLLLVGWGPRQVYGCAPAGSKAGLVMQNKGDVVPGFDAFGNRFEAYTTMFEQELNIVPEDWRWIVRLANLDTTSAGLAGPNATDLFVFMDQMLQLVPQTGSMQTGNNKTDAPKDPGNSTRLVFYCNRTIRHFLNVQSIRDRNVLLTKDDYDGRSVETYRGIPIKTMDQMLNSETRVTAASGPL
jgi:hypothetical protein